MATREICKSCGNIITVGFSVPDHIWDKAVPGIWKNDCLCLNCFTRFADEQLIPWDNYIDFYPVSLYSHINEKDYGILH